MESCTLIALIHGPDKPGLVARAAGWIFERGGSILHADQHRDTEAGIFFQRIEWDPNPESAAADPTHEGEASGFRAFASSELGMKVTVARSTDRPKVALWVSKAAHCFHDIALRWKAGEFGCDIVAVVSNHRDLEPIAKSYGLNFHHVPVEKGAKHAAEAVQLKLMRELDVSLVVLARYMQVLSSKFLNDFGRPVINIHHSFLPAFAGGRPYHQAHVRGVKLIGATAHYATETLDEGPIIHQDVTRVTHRHGVPELIRKGSDLEKLVLAQAVRWHLENRVLVYGAKTVVFD